MHTPADGPRELAYPIPARDDFYAHTNAQWLISNAIPADRDGCDSISQLEQITQERLVWLIQGLGSRPADRKAAKIAALYASFINEARADELGTRPIKGDLTRIQAVQSKPDLAALIAYFNRRGVPAPYDLFVHQDGRDPTRYVLDIHQSGLGLPDPGYYSSAEPDRKALQEKYQAHIARMLTLLGNENAREQALEIVRLETALADAQWSTAKNRDPVATYNKYRIADLTGLTGAYDWQRYLREAGLESHVEFVIVSQPSYLAAFGRLMNDMPLAVWKSYFSWRLLSAAAPYLSGELVQEHFAFYGTLLRGIPQNSSRSSRAADLVNHLLGELLGKLYVDQYFTGKTKDDVDAMVQVVLAAFRTRIKSLDWMGPDSKKVAQEKLNKLVLKIGSPTKPEDYASLEISRDDLYGNVTAAANFEYQRKVAKLGKPIDRDEWKILPQTPASYYDPQLNDVVFSAALLQAPFYDAKADLALNYGAIGVVISQQIARSFDDVGTHFDGNGKLSDWLKGNDHDGFDAKVHSLLSQYGAPAATGGAHGSAADAIAYSAGLAIAYRAFRLASLGKELPILDGLNADQRFFGSFARVHHAKVRSEAALLERSLTQQAAPEVRVNTALMNQPEFLAAFGLESGDKMYLPPNERIGLW